MDFLSIIIIAIGLAMDSFAVCISKGMCRQKFNAFRSFKIALVFGIFQGVMPLIGYALGVGFTSLIERIDHWLAFVILLIIGAKMIYESLLSKEEIDCNCNCQESEAINWKVVVTMAFATSIDALATGLIFVPYHDMIIKAVVTIGVVSFLFAFVGMLIGVNFGKRIKIDMTIIGGIILILIGTKILLGHTVFA
ncbi:MAG: manganese efflux pump MntP family protein [Dysgonamonadaceae bacterium]